ncbi:hypothetical protein [Flavisolibacter tropicus]|uniref:Uncharacterized protein n=1 Tax=Flavisolibacter tropicus TaxID=1492898 RepID=A0A172TUI6_9BACT|nr:hypothetical protein [Flavisolibacter tropicus]ANE50755.1 hypothetical protein SY85_09845 [Flavisolibacter tropicus]
MRLPLTATKTVAEVKEAFHEAFPYLKIEFFTNPHQKGEGSLPQQYIKPDTLLIDITGVMKEGNVSIEPSTTTAAFEEQLQNQYSLPIQVFRNSNGVWIETTETDNLTLAEQNEMGRQASLHTAHREKGYYED